MSQKWNLSLQVYLIKSVNDNKHSVGDLISKVVRADFLGCFGLLSVIVVDFMGNVCNLTKADSAMAN